jgi:hypothetical protein
MWSYLCHLLSQSLAYYPNIFSGNWFTVGVLPPAAFAFKERTRIQQVIRDAVNRKRQLMSLARQSWMLIAFYVLVFVFAVFHTAYTDREGLANENAQLKTALQDAQKSSLQLSIDGFGFFPSEGLSAKKSGSPIVKDRGTWILVFATVRNTGSPSIADDWGLSLDVPGVGTNIIPHMADFYNFQPSAVFHIGDDAIPNDKVLYLETKTPIAAGDKKAGILIYFLKGITKDKLENVRTKFYLTCKDIAGKPISAHSEWIPGTNKPYRHTMGLE